jgi:hypothetical protein
MHLRGHPGERRGDHDGRGTDGENGRLQGGRPPAGHLKQPLVERTQDGRRCRGNKEGDEARELEGQEREQRGDGQQEMGFADELTERMPDPTCQSPTPTQ